MAGVDYVMLYISLQTRSPPVRRVVDVLVRKLAKANQVTPDPLQYSTFVQVPRMSGDTSILATITTK